MDELDASARLRVRLAGAAAGLVAAVLVLLAGASVRQPLTDAFQRIWPADFARPHVQVVLIDAPSLAAVGGWPWSRYAMARLTEEIARRGAKVIGFDFLFPEPDRASPSIFAGLYPELPPATAEEIRKLPSMDGVFARVIGRNPVVLARAGVAKGSYDSLGAAAPLPPEATIDGRAYALETYPEVVANLPILDGAPLGHGLVNGPHDADGVLRRVPLVAKAAGAVTPGFALELVRVAEGDAGLRLTASPQGPPVNVYLGRHRLQADMRGRMAFRFGDLPTSATTSAADLFRTGVPSDAFKGKIVIVGLTAAGTSDVVATPREAETFGVFVQAQAVEAILTGGQLVRSNPVALLEVILGLVLAILAWALTPRFGVDVMLGVVGVAVLAVSAAAWGFLHGQIVDPAPVVAPATATAAAMVGMLFVEGRVAQRRLRAALEGERLAAAKVEGELSAASEIQAGMLLPRRALREVCDRVELDAVLLPARRVGGDLYDAFRLDEGQLCVLVGDATGKGVPAALFMALSKALARSLLSRPDLGLGAAIEAINAELSRDNGQMMAVALLVVVVDLASGELSLVSAGHENPILVDADGSARELRLDGGPPLCAAEGFRYPVERARLAPGETLVVVTDGVTEAQDPCGALFGRERALAAAAAGARRSVGEAVDGVVAAVRAFEAGGEPSDDMTVLALRLRPSGR